MSEKKKKRLVKREIFWLQVVMWTVMLFMPLMFLAPDQPIKVTSYLSKAVIPFALLVIFYANYLWLAPRLFHGKNEIRKWWLINVITITVLSFSLGKWADVEIQKRHNELVARGETVASTISFFPHYRLIIFCRDFINLFAAAIVGSAMVMNRRWVELEKAHQQAEVARREAELKNLRNQVNPHFLLNTLNNIYALTAFDQSKAQTAIMELGKMMRHILHDNQQPYVNLREEADFIHNYVDLMKMRLASNVTVKEEVDIPTPCTIFIAPMLLISLVENAFKHGVSPTQPSEISFRLSADTEKIFFTISNTCFPKSSTDQSGHGVGLKQVQQRLDLTYPDQYEWTKGLDNNNHYTSTIIIHDTQLHHH